MIDFKYADLFKQNSVDIQLEIISDDGKIHITNTEFHEEEFELTESLCSQSELTFGAVEAGSVKFKVSNIFLPMKGRWMTVKMIIGGHTDQPFLIGRFKGYSDTPTADRKYRDVVAYDALYDILNADVAAWYNTVFPSHKEQQKDKDGKTTTVTVYDPVTMKQFRNSFFKHFGIEQADIALINDNMSIEKTVAVTASSETSSATEESSTIGESMSGKEVLSCICEINGCMGHMGRDGKFHYIYLEQNIQGLYPRNDLYPADDLFPRDPKSNRIGKDLYITAEYEDSLVKTINKLQIREQKNDIGVIVGTGDNAYVIEDDFLVYGKGTKELKGIAKNILSKIRGIVYRPFTADCKGNPCLEVGDAVRLPTRYELIESYILKRTLKGIQALRDDLEADGEEYRTSKANGIQRSILQLKGKSNVLERSIEKTQSTIEDKERKLISQITQTATEIRTEVKNTADGLSSRITQNANNITAEVKRAQGQEVELAAAIKINEDKITAEVTRASEAEGDLSGKIEVTATKIRSEVSASLTVWDTEDYDVTHCGLGNPQDTYPASSYYSGHSFLDQNTGKFYGCEPDGGISSGKYKWTLIKKFKQLSSSASSTITQSSKQISLKVSKDSVISEINQSAEGIKIKAKLLELKGSMEITGGYVHIQTEESTANLIEFKRSGTCVQMGTDGFKAVEGTLESPNHQCVVQYNHISLNKGGTDTDHCMINLDGDTGVAGFRGGIIDGSDKRIKNTIKDLDKHESAKTIYSLKPKSYRYNFEETGYHHGFIAQEVLKSVKKGWNICPKAFPNENGEVFYGMRYTELIADLVATVQLQHEEIENLKEKVESL
ncbi:tail fiber domain-containing protein [Roseburia sp.]|uniref:tail fiber domain-containing protein n=1 Tax=Roseburia sp. TaxID=2049040 RepID=UPI0035212CFC